MTEPAGEPPGGHLAFRDFPPLLTLPINCDTTRSSLKAELSPHANVDVGAGPVSVC